MPTNQELQNNQKEEIVQGDQEIKKFIDLPPEQQNLTVLAFRKQYDKNMTYEQVEKLYNMSPKDRDEALAEFVQEKKEDLKENVKDEVDEVIEMTSVPEGDVENLESAKKEELEEIKEEAIEVGEDVKDKIEAVGSEEVEVEKITESPEAPIESQGAFESVDDFRNFINNINSELSAIDKQIENKDKQKETNEQNHLVSKAMTAKINADIETDIENLNVKKQELQTELDKYEEPVVMLKKIEQYEEQKAVNEKNHLLSKAMAAKINSEIDRDIDNVNNEIEKVLIGTKSETADEIAESSVEEGAETVEKVEEKPAAEKEASKIENTAEFIGFFQNINLGDFKTQKNIEQLQQRFAAVFTPELLSKLNIDPSLKDGIVNKYFDSMLSKVEEYLQVGLAKKQSKGFFQGFKKEVAKLGKAAWGGALYSATRNLVEKTIGIASTVALPLKVLLGGVTGAGVAAFNHLIGYTWDAAKGKNINKLAKKLAMGGFDADEMFGSLQSDMGVLLNGEAQSNELLELYGNETEDEDIKKLINSTKEIKQGKVANEHVAIQERQKMIKDLVASGKFDTFISDQVSKELAKLRTEQGEELDEQAKYKLMKRAQLVVARDINVILGDVVAQEKFAEIDESGKSFFEKGYTARLLGRAPADTLMQKIYNGFISGSVAGLVYTDATAGFIYMSMQRIQGTLRAETLRESKDSTVVKTASEVIVGLDKITAEVKEWKEEDVRQTIREARARVKLPDMKEIDRAKIELSIRKLENAFIMHGTLLESKQESEDITKTLSGEIIGEREAGIKKAVELAAEEKKRKSWFGKKGVFSQFLDLDLKTKAKVLLKAGKEGVLAGVGAALGTELLNLGTIAVGDFSDPSLSNITEKDIKTSINNIADRASFTLAGRLGMEFAVEQNPLGGEFNEKDKAKVMAEAQARFEKEHSIVEGDVKYSQNETGEIVASLNIEIGKDGDYNHLDQALRRIVIDNYNLADNKVDVYDDAKVENMVANLRNNILDNDVRGVSFNEKTGELVIDNYTNLGVEIDKLQINADDHINDKSDALAYTDNTSHEIMKDLWEKKIISQNPDVDRSTIEIEDASKSDLVKAAEQRVFESQTKEYFSNLGDGVTFEVGSEEDGGIVRMGNTEFNVEGNRVTAIDGVGLSKPLILDDKFQENFIVFKIGKDYGMDLEDLKTLGVIESGNFDVTEGEKEALLYLHTLYKPGHEAALQEFLKQGYTIRDFDIGQGKEDNNRAISFLIDSYEKGEYISKETFVTQSQEVKDMKLALGMDLGFKSIHALEGEGYRFNINTDLGKVEVMIPQERGGGIVSLNKNGDAVLEVSKNFLSNGEKTHISLDPKSMQSMLTIHGGDKLYSLYDDLVKQEMAQNKLFIEAEIYGVKDGLLDIPMEPKYIGVALDHDAEILKSEERFIEAMKEYGKDHDMRIVGQKNNFEKLYEIIDSKDEHRIAKNPPIEGETVRQYLVRVVGPGSNEAELEQVNIESKYYNPNLANNLLEENQDLVKIVESDREFLDEMRDRLHDLRKEAGEAGKELKESIKQVSDLEGKKAHLMAELMKKPGDAKLHTQIREVSTQLNNARMYEQGGAQIQDNAIQSKIEALQSKIAVIERDVDDSQDQIQSNLQAYENNVNKPYSLDYLGEQNQEKILSEMNEELDDVPEERRAKFTNDVMEVVREMDKDTVTGSSRAFIKAFHEKAEEKEVDMGGLTKPAANQMLRIVYSNLGGDNQAAYNAAYDDIAEANLNYKIHEAKTIGEFYHLPSEDPLNNLLQQSETTPADGTLDSVNQQSQTPVAEPPKVESTPISPTPEAPKEVPKVAPNTENVLEKTPTQNATVEAMRNNPMNATKAEDLPTRGTQIINGKSYDMSNPADRQAVAEINKDMNSMMDSSGDPFQGLDEKTQDIAPKEMPKVAPEASKEVPKVAPALESVPEQASIPPTPEPPKVEATPISPTPEAPKVAPALESVPEQTPTQNATVEAMRNNPMNATKAEDLPTRGTQIINGKSYDMSNPADRQAVAEINKDMNSMMDSSGDPFKDMDNVMEEKPQPITEAPKEAPKAVPEVPKEVPGATPAPEQAEAGPVDLANQNVDDIDHAGVKGSIVESKYVAQEDGETSTVTNTTIEAKLSGESARASYEMYSHVVHKLMYDHDMTEDEFIESMEKFKGSDIDGSEEKILRNRFQGLQQKIESAEDPTLAKGVLRLSINTVAVHRANNMENMGNEFKGLSVGEIILEDSIDDVDDLLSKRWIRSSELESAVQDLAKKSGLSQEEAEGFTDQLDGTGGRFKKSDLDSILSDDKKAIDIDKFKNVISQYKESISLDSRSDEVVESEGKKTEDITPKEMPKVAPEASKEVPKIEPIIPDAVPEDTPETNINLNQKLQELYPNVPEDELKGFNIDDKGVITRDNYTGTYSINKDGVLTYSGGIVPNGKEVGTGILKPDGKWIAIETETVPNTESATAGDILKDASLDGGNEMLNSYDKVYEALKSNPDQAVAIPGATFTLKDGKVYLELENSTTGPQLLKENVDFEALIKHGKELDALEGSIKEDEKQLSALESIKASSEAKDALLVNDDPEKFKAKISGYKNITPNTGKEILGLVDTYKGETENPVFVLKEMPNGRGRLDVYDDTGKMLFSTYTKGNIRT